MSLVLLGLPIDNLKSMIRGIEKNDFSVEPPLWVETSHLSIRDFLVCTLHI